MEKKIRKESEKKKKEKRKERVDAIMSSTGHAMMELSFSFATLFLFYGSNGKFPLRIPFYDQRQLGWLVAGCCRRPTVIEKMRPM